MNPLKICSLQWLSDVNQLTTLIMYGTQQVVFPNVKRSRYTLSEINVAFNNITEIHPNLLEDFTALETLNERGNSLQSLPLMKESPIKFFCAGLKRLTQFANLLGAMNKTLKLLHLEFNIIERVRHEDIYMLESLRELNLIYNQIYTVLDPRFLPHLLLVQLEGNKLTCDCHLSWVKHVNFVTLSIKPCTCPYGLISQNWTDIDVPTLIGNCPNETTACPVADFIITTHSISDTTYMTQSSKGEGKVITIGKFTLYTTVHIQSE